MTKGLVVLMFVEKVESEKLKEQVRALSLSLRTGLASYNSCQVHAYGAKTRASDSESQKKHILGGVASF